MKKSKLVLPLIIAAGLTAGCNKHHHAKAIHGVKTPLETKSIIPIPTSTPTPTILGYINNIPITSAYIDAHIAPQVDDLKVQTVEMTINQYILQQLASKKGVTIEQYMKSMPQDQLINKVTELRKQYNSKVLIEPTKYNVPDVSSNPTLGQKDAPVKIIEFADFQCPYCQATEPVLNQIRKTYGSKVSLTYMYFPLPFHQYAESAAKHAVCADKQGKFWEMHDYMYANQDKLTDADLETEAKTLKLDPTSYDKCLSDPVTANIIQNNKNIATALGVTGTPTFFINGHKISGAQPLFSFTDLIDQELSKK